jgi:hypothetical protein
MNSDNFSKSNKQKILSAMKHKSSQRIESLIEKGCKEILGDIVSDHGGAHRNLSGFVRENEKAIIQEIKLKSVAKIEAYIDKMEEQILQELIKQSSCVADKNDSRIFLKPAAKPKPFQASEPLLRSEKLQTWETEEIDHNGKGFPIEISEVQKRNDTVMTISTPHGGQEFDWENMGTKSTSNENNNPVVNHRLFDSNLGNQKLTGRGNCDTGRTMVVIDYYEQAKDQVLDNFSKVTGESGTKNLVQSEPDGFVPPNIQKSEIVIEKDRIKISVKDSSRHRSKISKHSKDSKEISQVIQKSDSKRGQLLKFQNSAIIDEEKDNEFNLCHPLEKNRVQIKPRTIDSSIQDSICNSNMAFHKSNSNANPKADFSMPPPEKIFETSEIMEEYGPTYSHSHYTKDVPVTKKDTSSGSASFNPALD